MHRRDAWKAAADRLDLKQLARIARDARYFRDIVQRLRRSVLVKQLSDQGVIPPGDLLDRTYPLHSFRGMTQLDQLARKSGLGPKSKPDRREDIVELVNLVKKNSGQFHYEKLEQILSALGIQVKLKQYMADQRKRQSKSGKKTKP